MAERSISLDTVVDLEEAKKFAKTLWGNTQGQGDIVFCLLRNRSNIERTQFSGDFSPESVGEGLQNWVDSGWNIYATPCRFNPNRETGKDSRKASDVILVPGVWADLDVKEDTNLLPNTEAELQKILEQLSRPTIMVDSGSGGRHAYWLFDEPVRDMDVAKRLTVSWIVHLSAMGTRALGREIKFDPVGDLSRILRLPGTWRFPKPPYNIYQPRKVNLIYDNGPRYSVNQIEQSIPYTILDEYDRVGSNVISGNGKKIDISIEDHPKLQAYVNRAIEKEKKQLASWETGVPPGRNSMLNRAAFSLGTLGAHGFLDIDTARDHLLEACRENGLLTEDGSNACESTFESGWSAGLSNPRELSEDFLETEQEDCIVGLPGDHIHTARYVTNDWNSTLIGPEAGSIPVIRRWREDWWERKSDGSWAVIDDETLERGVTFSIHGKYWSFKDDEGNDTRKLILVNNNLRKEMTGALKATLLAPPGLEQPFWLDEAQHNENLPKADELIVFQNGMLRWKDRYFTGHDPRLFTTVSLSCDYDENAKCEEWLKFLDSLFPDDQESIEALQEIFGYIITGQMNLQKIFLIVGAPRTGKSTIASILKELVGDDNVAGLSVNDIAKNFSLEALMGKKFNLCSDARIRGDTYKVVEKLVGISGGDPQSIDRKFKKRQTVTLKTNFVIISNEIPNFDDPSGAIASRFLPIQIKAEGWLGREDYELPDRLRAELPGIFNWALDGADRLMRKKRFTEPEASINTKNQLEDSSSRIKVFIEDCCIINPNIHTSKKELYKVWKNWCDDNLVHAGSPADFTKKLKSRIPSLDEARPRLNGGKQTSVYVGIGLNEEELNRANNRWL